MRSPRALHLAMAAAILLVVGLAAPKSLDSHEIPSRVTVLAFLKPEGRTLRVIVRVPLQSMRDVEMPLRAGGGDFGYLDIERAAAMTREAAQLWIADYLQLFEGVGRLANPAILATRVSLPSDRSFGDYESALRHVLGPPLPAETDLPWQQALLDVLLEYPISAATSDFSIDPMLGHLGMSTTTVLRFQPPESGERVFQYTGNPGVVRLDPRWHQAALRFVRMGFVHILDGLDHVLFVICLVIPFRRLRPLIVIVTSFTVAHSITLIASASGLAPSALWFQPLIETLIALSIVYMAFENIVGPRLERRWIIAFAFGLVHGFGFSFVLRDSMQFAGAHLAASLVAFNVGVELGQLLVVAVTIPVLDLLFRRVVAERMGTILASALVAHTAWHWMTERGSDLLQFRVQLPTLDMALAASAMRGAMLIVIVGGVMWLLSGFVNRMTGLGRRTPGGDATAAATDSTQIDAI